MGCWGRLGRNGGVGGGEEHRLRLHLKGVPDAVFFLDQIGARVEEGGQRCHGGEHGDGLT
jgi:hypothetical protein